MPLWPQAIWACVVATPPGRAHAQQAHTAVTARAAAIRTTDTCFTGRGAARGHAAPHGARARAPRAMTNPLVTRITRQMPSRANRGATPHRARAFLPSACPLPAPPLHTAPAEAAPHLDLPHVHCGIIPVEQVPQVAVETLEHHVHAAAAKPEYHVLQPAQGRRRRQQGWARWRGACAAARRAGVASGADRGRARPPPRSRPSLPIHARPSRAAPLWPPSRPCARARAHSTMLSCRSSLSRLISRSVELGSPWSSNPKRSFFSAMISSVSRFLALYTTAYEPLPSSCGRRAAGGAAPGWLPRVGGGASAATPRRGAPAYG